MQPTAQAVGQRPDESTSPVGAKEASPIPIRTTHRQPDILLPPNAPNPTSANVSKLGIRSAFRTATRSG